MLNFHGDNYKSHTFDDPKLLAAWSKHKDYRCAAAPRQRSHRFAQARPLTYRPPPPPPRPRSYSDKLPAAARDFPEARERLAAKELAQRIS